LPDFASQQNPSHLRELLKPVIMQQDIYGEDAVKARFISDRELRLGRQDLEKFLTNPESFWIALMSLRVGVV
jgi:hypothetical protein